MHDEVKKRVDNKDIRGLQFVFADCLDVDPTFEKYKEDYEYCRKMLPEMFESHIELIPFNNNQSDWTDDYWNNIKMDLLENFSIERFEHMQEVAKVVYAEKIERLIQEREAARKKLEKKQKESELARKKLEQKNSSSEDKLQANQENQNYRNVNALNNTHKDYTNQNMQVQQQIKSQKQKQEEELEAERRALAQKNQRFEENKAREEQRKEQLRRSENIQVSGGTETKKVMGAVLVIVVFLIIVIIVVMAMRN